MVKVICIQTDQEFLLQDLDYPSMTWELEEVGSYWKRCTISWVYIVFFTLRKSNSREILRTDLRPLLLNAFWKRYKFREQGGISVHKLYYYM